MAEQVQIDLVVNTTQLDVAEARYDALKARQLGMQGGTVAPGLGVPGATAGAAVGAMMARVVQVQTTLNASTALQVAAPNSLLSLEQATVAGFARHQQSLNRPAVWDFQTGIMSAKADLPGIVNNKVPSIFMDDPVVQNKFASDYFAAEYFRQTGRVPPNGISAANMREAIVRDQELARGIQASTVQAAGNAVPPLSQAATGAAGATMWSKAKKAAALLSSSAAGRLLTKKIGGIGKGATKIGRFGGAMIALAALNNYTDDIIEDAEFRKAAGIADNEGENIADRGLGGSISQFSADTHGTVGGTAAKLWVKALAPFSSYATTNERMRNLETNIADVKAGGFTVLASDSRRAAAHRAAKTIKQARADMIRQNEWSSSFQEGINELDSRADAIAQDFAQRFYGGGDVGRGDVAAWVKQGAVQYQKGKYAEEAWKQHPNSRIAKDPPKE